MFERPTGGDRALLVELDLGDGEPAERVAELKALARSAGAEIADVVTARRNRLLGLWAEKYKSLSRIMDEVVRQ